MDNKTAFTPAGRPRTAPRKPPSVAPVHRACLLTLDVVAESLCVSARTVRRLVTAGELPVVRVGRQVRVHPGDLDRFVQARRG